MNDWISIEDEKPDHNGVFLVHSEENGVFVSFFIDRQWKCVVNNEAVTFVHPFGITHWMPLPLFPKNPILSAQKRKSNREKTTERIKDFKEKVVFSRGEDLDENDPVQRAVLLNLMKSVQQTQEKLNRDAIERAMASYDEIVILKGEKPC